MKRINWITLIALMVIMSLLSAGCQKAKVPQRPSREYTGTLEDRFGAAGVDLLSYIGGPLEQVKKDFQSEIYIDEEVGVAFVNLRGRPPVPDEWGMRSGEHEPSTSFLCAGVPDKDFNYSYDMLVQEASMSFEFPDGYPPENLKTVLDDVLRGIRLQAGTPQSLAREFLEGNDIRVTLNDKRMKGLVSIYHREGQSHLRMRITNQAGFFD